MKYASIDIGTNTILMLIGTIDGTETINPIKDFYSVPRLGKSVSATRMLDSDSIARATEILKKYRGIADDYDVSRVFASATSAVRDATNRDQFISAARELCGINVEVIPGETEAKLGFLGAVSGEPDKSRRSLVIDIGGGSTEFSYGSGSEPSHFQSINVGAVRITEMFFKHVPPLDDEIQKAEKYIEDALKNFPFIEISPDRVFAVAGTATTIALIAQERYEFTPEAVNNYRMSTTVLKDVVGRLRWKTPDEIRKLTEAAEGREDVILAGTLILDKAIEAAGVSEFLSTDRGLRYGYLLYKHMQSSGR